MKQLSAELYKNNIPIIFLRELEDEDDYEYDIYISEPYLAEARSILEVIGWKPFGQGEKLYNLLRLHKNHEQWFLVDKGTGQVLKLDIITTFLFQYNGNTYKYQLEGDDQKRGNVHAIMSTEEKLNILLLHVILEKKYLSTKNQHIAEQFIQEIYQNGSSVSTRLLNPLRKVRDKIAVPHIQMMGLLSSSKKVASTEYVSRLPGIIRRLLMRIFYKRKINIIFIGIDGSGKSTISTHMASLFSNICTLRYGGFKAHSSSWLNNMNVYRNNNINRKIRSVILRLVYHFFFTIELLTQNARTNLVSIFDRHPFFDILLELNRSQAKSPIMSMIKNMYRVTFRRKKTMVIFCLGDPLEINRRKDERSINEIKAYNEIVTSIITDGMLTVAESHILDTTMEINSTLDKATRLCASFISRELYLA